MREGMKAANGMYLNLFSEQGYSSYNLPEDIDVFLIFPEYMGDEIDFDEFEHQAQRIIKNFASTNGPKYDYKILKRLLEESFDDLQVVIK